MPKVQLRRGFGGPARARAGYTFSPNTPVDVDKGDMDAIRADEWLEEVGDDGKPVSKKDAKTREDEEQRGYYETNRVNAQAADAEREAVEHARETAGEMARERDRNRQETQERGQAPGVTGGTSDAAPAGEPSAEGEKVRAAIERRTTARKR